MTFVFHEDDDSYSVRENVDTITPFITLGLPVGTVGFLGRRHRIEIKRYYQLAGVETIYAHYRRMNYGTVTSTGHP